MEWRPVDFATRSMTETEKRYAQVEKVVLVVTCDNFSTFVFAKNFAVETDHKSSPTPGNKQSGNLPPKILKFKLQQERFQFSNTHIPEKDLYIRRTH